MGLVGPTIAPRLDLLAHTLVLGRTTARATLDTTALAQFAQVFLSFLFSPLFLFLSFLSTLIAQQSTTVPRGAPTTAPQRGQHALPLVLGHSLVLAFLAILGLESLAQVVFFFLLSFFLS